MTRVPVPDEYDRGYVTVSGSRDYHYGESDVNLDDVERARNVRVREDAEGRYVSVNANYADAVAAFLGVTTSDEQGSGTDSDDTDTEGETYTCSGETAGGDPCTREVDEPGGYCYQHGPEEVTD